jgi:hypothetical protein
MAVPKLPRSSSRFTDFFSKIQTFLFFILFELSLCRGVLDLYGFTQLYATIASHTKRRRSMNWNASVNVSKLPQPGHRLSLSTIECLERITTVTSGKSKTTVTSGKSTTTTPLPALIGPERMTMPHEAPHDGTVKVGRFGTVWTVKVRL